MMQSDELIKLVAALGGGASISAIITALIAARSQKGKSRAEAADLLIGAAERVGKMNAQQDEEIQKLKIKLDAVQYTVFQFLAGDIDRIELLDKMRELR